MKILIYGIGNPGRQDDGIGTIFAEEIERAVSSGAEHEFSFDANYQLNIEDAEEISRHDIVVFADAAKEGEAFRLYRLNPEPTASFTAHSVSPGGIVALCSELYAAHPHAYMLAIRGYEWEVNAPLSVHARTNLDAAVQFLLTALHPQDGDDRADGHSLLDRFVS